MRTRILSLLIVVSLLGATPAMAQLPPEVLADAHLLRAEQSIRDGDPTRTRAEIDKIIVLQKEHKLDLSEEFHFRSAKVAAAAGLPDRALEAVVKYLAAAGRDGPHYVEALELMNQTQDEIAGRKVPQAASPGSAPPPTIETPTETLLETGDTADGHKEQVSVVDPSGTPEAPAMPECDLSAWNRRDYFKTATSKEVTACLDIGADPNARTYYHKETPLHYAASNENPAVVQALIKAGADPNARDDDKETPLHRAASNENPAVVQALIKAGADPKARNDDKETPLHYAVRWNENPAVVQALIKAGADLNARDKYKRTPLHYAVWWNENPAVVQALIKAGADPNARDKYKRTPLHRAAFNENPAVVQALIKAGADPNARNDDKETPLHYADLFNRNPAVSKALLAAGADAKVRIEYKWTPLHEAAKHVKDAGVIEALLAAGSDPNARVAKYKYTPLHYAARSNENPAVVQALIKAGADPKARDDDKETPLHRAASNENPAVVQALIKAGADPKARNDDKDTPLHYAVRWNENPAVVQALINAGADPNARDKYKRTPLHYAVRWNENPAVVQALINAGADPNARDKYKDTPLDRATIYKNLAAIEILRHPTAVRGRQIAAARARRKANSGPGFLAAAIGIVGGTAIAAAGGGSEEAVAAGTIFAEGVVSGQSPAGSTSSAPGVAPTGSVGAGAGSEQCEIPGYPRPADVQNLGLSWCPATVDFQARVFALQAAGAQCAIATGSSSTPEQIQARRHEIQAVCARLAALGVPNCRCP